MTPTHTLHIRVGCSFFASSVITSPTFLQKKLVYKEFPCLQNEWTYKIRNAEPPTFAKLRKLNRITQLEELYGHLLDQQNMDTNDTPNYEP